MVELYPYLWLNEDDRAVQWLVTNSAHFPGFSWMIDLANEDVCFRGDFLAAVDVHFGHKALLSFSSKSQYDNYSFQFSHCLAYLLI